MKTKVYPVITLLAFMALIFVSNGFTQQALLQPSVQLIYFLPNDRSARPERIEALRQLIKDTQQFYADEMERHGYGRKTFRVETDTDGEPIVHRFNGQFNEQYYYQRLTDFKVWKEFFQQVNDLQHVYLIAIDLSSEVLNEGESCGLGGVSFLPSGRDRRSFFFGSAAVRHRDITPGEEVLGGSAIMPASGHCFYDTRGFLHPLRLITHELAHAFGLDHDFSDPDSAVGGRGFRFSKCDTEWLSVSRFFNSKAVSENASGNIQLISAPTYSAEGITLHFEVSDADGLHQAQLLVPEDGSWGPWKLIGCQALDGQTQQVEFLSSELTSAPERVMLQFMDDLGNITWATFLVDIVSLLPPPKVVSIPDPNLKQAIRSQLGLASGDMLTDRAMKKLGSLNVDDRKITNIAGLEYATQLRELLMGRNQIKSYDRLAELPNLTTLYLWANNISDLSVLPLLPKLELLDLNWNHIRDVSRLAGFTNLTTLMLTGNKISDVSPLTGLANLEVLHLEGNPIQDTSVLASLTKLRDVDIDIHLEVPLVDDPFDITNISEPVPPPAAVRDFFQLDSFYQQWINVDGFPILASAKVSPYAVKEVAWLIHQITRHTPAALRAMVQNKVRFCIVAHNEIVTELPEHRGMTPEPDFFFAVRRGGAYCPRCLTAHVTEEDVFSTGRVTIHEFAHAVHEAGLNTIDPTFDDRLRETYNSAMARGLWQNSYASTNMSEYWAEGVATWFHANPNFQSVTTRTALKNYDPGLASLLSEIFGDGTWRYMLPATRTHLSHLRGFNPQKVLGPKLPTELLETYEQFTSNPDNDGGGKWVNLQQYAPSQLPNLNKSRTIGDSAVLYFMNHTGATVALYRVNPDGPEVHDRNVGPLNFIDIGVHIGEILLIKDATGKEFAVFLVGEKARGFIVRAFVGNPEPIRTAAEVPTTGTNLAVVKPPQLARGNFAIGPGEFTILVHNGQRAVVKQAHFKTHDAYSGLGNNSRDIPNLAQFFQNGGRIELISLSYDHAQFGDIVISEIMWGLDGTSPAKQYIELYNASAHTYTFADADLSLRFSTASQEPLPDGRFPPPYNPNAHLKVLDRVSNKGWKALGKSGNTSKNQPLISMYRTIDYTTGDIPDGTLASSWKASTGQVNLPAPSYGTPGAAHLPPRPVVQVNASERPPMYWIDTTTGTLQRLVNTEVENLEPDVRNATDLAIDMTGGKLYWTERTNDRTGNIRRANLDGTNVQLVKELTSVPYGIALDTANRKIYLTNSWGKVQRLNFDGSNFQPNLITGLADLNDIAVDVVNHKVYWTEKTSDRSSRIRRANLDGSNLQQVKILTNVPLDIAIDTSVGKIYLTDASGKIQRLNFDGSNFQPNLITRLKDPKGIAVDVIGGRVYWTEKGSIRRASFNGENIEEVATNLGNPVTLVLDISLPSHVPSGTGSQETMTTPSADINEDGKVNKSDLLLVVTALGETSPTNPRVDVDGDGRVAIADLLLVIENLDDPVVGAAPTIITLPVSVDVKALEAHLNLLRVSSDDSRKYQYAIAMLEGLLASMRPTATQLLANYPNPFNPETWIPYHLAEPADVTLTIYASDGTMVRTLRLGHQPVGIYQTRSRAAHWDGKNELGESVASGVYFYTLSTESTRDSVTAGDFSATRKMLIRK